MSPEEARQQGYRAGFAAASSPPLAALIELLGRAAGYALAVACDADRPKAERERAEEVVGAARLHGAEVVRP